MGAPGRTREPHVRLTHTTSRAVKPMTDDVERAAPPGKRNLPVWTPHAIEVEQSLLGAALLNPEAVQMVDGYVSQEDFGESLHASIWEIMTTMHAAGRHLDVKLLIAAIGANATIPIPYARMNVAQYIARLAAEATTVINARDYAVTIRDLADQRKLADIGASLKHETKIDPNEVAADAIDRLDQIVARRVNTGTPGLEMKEASVRALDAIAAAYQRDGSLSGITWGLKDLDNKTLGIHKAELTILAGRPGMGKTAVGLCVARSAAEAGHKVLFESLEMGDQPLTQRMISDVLFDQPGKPLPYWLMRSGRFREEDFTRITDAARRVALLPIRIEQRPAMTVSQIASQARQRKRRHGLDLLVVDHMHLIKPSDRYKGNRVNELGEVTSGLKALGKELDIAVLALCQLSRTLESRDSKKPTMADLRGSGDIEQDADAVVMLYREAYYLERNEPTPGSPESLVWQDKMEKLFDKLEAIIEKQRNGPIGTVELFCNISCNAVRDVGKEQYLPETPDHQPELGL